MMKTIQAILFFCLGLVSISAMAEQKKVFAGKDGAEYEVHYMALSSTFLLPEVARQYGLSRSKALGVINVSVLKVQDDGTKQAVGALVDINTKNDIQQVQHLDVNQVTEGRAIYYIAQVQFREGAVLTFDLSVYAQGEIDPFKIRFGHTFYND